MATTDIAAVGILHRAWALGLSVPTELSVVGYDDLYIAALNRPPTIREMRDIAEKIRLRAAARSKDTRTAMYEDLFWALLNSNEFILNH